MKTRPGRPTVQTATTRGSVGCTVIREIEFPTVPTGNGNVGGTGTLNSGRKLPGVAQAPAGALAVHSSRPLLKPTQPSTLGPGGTTGPNAAAVASTFAGGKAAVSPMSGTAVAALVTDEYAAKDPPPCFQAKMYC